MSKKLTPLDLQHQEFGKVFRGYDPLQVHQYLQEVADSLEALILENRDLQQKLENQTAEVQRLIQSERQLNETMVTAKTMTEQISANAKKESDMLIAQAEMQAEKMLQKAHERLTDMINEINEMKKQKAQFQGQLRGIIDTHLRLLEEDKNEPMISQIEDVGILTKVS
jgi:cell division initiation protein